MPPCPYGQSATSSSTSPPRIRARKDKLGVVPICVGVPEGGRSEPPHRRLPSTSRPQARSRCYPPKAPGTATPSVVTLFARCGGYRVVLRCASLVRRVMVIKVRNYKQSKTLSENRHVEQNVSAGELNHR